MRAWAAGWIVFFSSLLISSHPILLLFSFCFSFRFLISYSLLGSSFTAAAALVEQRRQQRVGGDLQLW
jgi:hypothetical protein